MEAEVKQDQYQPAFTLKQKKNVLGIVSTVLCVGLIGTTVALYTQLSDTKDKLVLAEYKVSQVTNDNVQIKQQIDTANKFINFLQFEHYAEQGIVTDSLYVNKIMFSGNDTPLNMTLDVANQPSMTLKYNGKGSYEMEDRDVKAMCARIVEEVKSSYDDWGSLPTWDDSAEIVVTVQNYELGTYKAGKFTLKGE
ncbi:hypothetical protein [Paenibacillus sp. ATY16]|uniref:hypothetical protein n=1 Tax=Paenibacillus sp. ATY16 TaxID=1759312 RepID=UPI00200D2C65|nr:hypothetical protein [Paenibacillus sp. ATY16]MCK9858335.1 hypothetical protein [Paenibacillus sp. ATY16]